MIIVLFSLGLQDKKMLELLRHENYLGRNDNMKAPTSVTRESNFQQHETFSQKAKITRKFHSDLSLTSYCRRWAVIVVSTDNSTEAIIERVLAMQSWCLVIVADQSTPLVDTEETLVQSQQENVGMRRGGQVRRGGGNLEKVFYLSREMQMEWEKVHGSFGKFVRSTPWGHLSRKNVGYLFAIVHGAEYIFDFDDDIHVKLDDHGIPLDILPTERDNPTEMKLENVNVIMQGSNVFNHYPIMGASVNQSWARGFPMEHIDNEYTHGKIAYQMDVPFVSPRKDIGVIQFLVDRHPDVNTMHHDKNHPLPDKMTFQFENAHPVLVPTHAYAPYNSRATIHTKNALWATLLPSTVPGGVSDIWRSYFAQCIFADAGIQLIFSPPKVLRKYSNHTDDGQENFVGKEQDLYKKSGALINFLSQWDSTHDNIPDRMRALWIDLYDQGYIRLEDVHAVEAWLGALSEIGYDFPPLKRRFRNVAVMGQFNYADNPSIVNDVIFWTQKNLERFHTVIAAGPFNKDQMKALADNSIHAISNHNDTVIGNTTQEAGYYTPLENLKNTLLYFKNSSKIEGVLYAHDDAILNITQLSNGQYPFPSDSFISNRFFHMRLATSEAKDMKLANKFSYRIFPDGHLEDFLKTASFHSIEDMYHNLPLKQWPVTMSSCCGQGQTELAKDPESAMYREKDGSILFSRFLQSDALFVPTKYADEFARAAELHLKHKIWIECSVNTVVDMVQQRTNATLRYVKLCTNWKPDVRGTKEFIKRCIDRSSKDDSGIHFGFIHPYKLGRHGYMEYDLAYEQLQ
jgi:Protein of unknown function, DUF288.